MLFDNIYEITLRIYIFLFFVKPLYIIYFTYVVITGIIIDVIHIRIQKLEKIGMQYRNGLY